MANEERLGASFEIDVTNLKAGLSQANRLIRESESEFKSAAAGMDDWSNSGEGLEAKIKSLNNITDIQQKKVNALQGEYDRLIEEGLDPTSKEAVELRTKINNETAALNKNKAEAEALVEKLKDLGNESKDAGDAAEEASDGFTIMKGAAADLVSKGISSLIGAIGNAVKSVFGLADSTREARNNMAKLETSFETAGLSAEAAENTFTELYGILGDDGAATEAAQQIAKISKNEEDLETNTRILTGVMAEYGASIPTEGLAEGMAATVAMGEVQGPLADALEWQGVNLEKVNEKLATMSTEEERTAYLQSMLIDLYGESADAYMENNAAVIEAQKAQAEMNAALNELGAIAEPIMTTLKQLATDLLVSITPFVSLIGEGLAGALAGADGAAESLAEGLNGIIGQLIGTVVRMLPFVIDTIVAVVPQLISELLAQVPNILRLLANVTEKIIYALSDMLPTIIAEIVALVPRLITDLLYYLPDLLAAATTLLMAIVDAVPTIITDLVSVLSEVIGIMVGTLTDSIPILLDAAIQLLLAIVDAIPTIIDALIEALPGIIDAIITSVLDALPLLLDAAITLFFAIVEAIPTIIKALISRLPQIIEIILTSLRDAIPKLFSTAKELLGKILDAVANLIVQLPSKVAGIISTMVDALRSGISKIKTIGSDIVKGLWNGIKDMGSWIANKLKGFGESVLGGIKDFFGIHSPSKVMADEVGKNLALGIGEGFADNIAGVNKQITGAMNFSSSTGQRGSVGGAGSVVVNQTNYYSQAHSRLELYKTKQNTAAAVRLAVAGA